MQRIIESIRKNLTNGNTIAAVYLAVTLPDACGNIEFPNDNVSTRYENWCQKYLTSSYETKWNDYNCIAKKMNIPYTDNGDGTYTILFLKSKCLYQLRCSLLHSGNTQIRSDKNNMPLGNFVNRFEFTNDISNHCHVRYYNNCLHNPETVLFLHTETFCEDVCTAVEKWLTAHPTMLNLTIEE